MSSSNIKAGNAYVSVSTRDDTKPGFDKIGSNFSALTKSIRRQSDLAVAATAAASARSAAAAVRDLQIQKRNVDKALPAARKGLFAGGTGAVSAEAGGNYKALVAQRAQLEQQITAALQTQASLEQAAAAALDRQDRLGAIRAARLKEATAELQRQNALNSAAAAAGQGAVRQGLAAGSNQNRISTLGSTAEANKLTRSLERQHGLINSQVKALMEQLRAMRASGAASAATAPVMATVRDLIAQRRDLESSINQIAVVRSGLAAREASLAQQIATAKAAEESAAQQAAREEEIRTAKSEAAARKRAAAEQAAADAAKQAAHTGQTATQQGLVRGTTQNKIGSLGSTAEADRLTRSFTQQRDLVNSQITALMEQLRTMRASGAASAATAPVMATVRDLIAQRRDLESSINQIAGVRTGLEASELSAEQQLTAEKEKQARLDQLAANEAARKKITAPKEARQNWNTQGSGADWSNTQGLSGATMLKYAKNVRQVQFSSDGAAKSSWGLSRGIAGVGMSSGRSQQLIQNAIYAADDAATSFGTNGWAGAIRGAGNNLTMMAAAFGPWAMLATVAATAAIQLYLAFNKGTKPTKDAARDQEELNSKLRDYNDLAKHRQSLKTDFSSESLNKKGTDLRSELGENEDVVGKLKKDLSDATVEADKFAVRKNEILSRQHWMNAGIDPTGDLDGATKDSDIADEKRAKIQEQLNEKLKEQQLIKTKLSETDERAKKMYDSERGHRNVLAAITREINEQNRAFKVQRDMQEMEIKYREKLNQLIREQGDELRKEADPQGAKREEMLREHAGRRQIMMMSDDPEERKRQGTLLTVASNRKMRELDKSDPLKQMGTELEGEINDLRGQRRRAIEQARDRLFELEQQKQLNPQNSKQIQQLQGGVKRSLATQLMAMDQARPNQANSAVEANSTEGMRAIIAATSRDSNTPQMQMFKAIVAGNELTADQNQLFRDFIKEFGGAPVLVGKSVK